MNSQDPTYALGRSDFEHQRLLDQARVVRPMTERLFRAAGIGPGMRVLDVGSGMGDVAFLDKARSRAELLGHANIRFVHGDLRSADLGGQFDAAVGRLVLLYLA